MKILINQKQHSIINITDTRELCSNRRSNQSVSLRSFPLFRSAVPVGRASLRSTDTSQHKKNKVAKNRQPHFFRCSFLIFTRSLPAFGRAIASTIPLHSVTLRRLRSTVFQPYNVCRPPLFSGCSFAPPSGLAPLP